MGGARGGLAWVGGKDLDREEGSLGGPRWQATHTYRSYKLELQATVGMNLFRKLFLPLQQFRVHEGTAFCLFWGGLGATIQAANEGAADGDKGKVEITQKGKASG